MKFFILNILIGATAFIVGRIESANRKTEATESLKNIQDIIEKIENQRIKQVVSDFVNGLINSSITNPMLIYVFMFVVYLTPFLNLLILIVSVIELFKKEVD